MPEENDLESAIDRNAAEESLDTPVCEFPAIAVPFALSYNKNNLHLKQVKRTAHVAMYAVYLPEGGDVTGYEVWKIRIRPARMAFGKMQLAKEWEPSNEDFGTWAWSWLTLAQAAKCFAEKEAESQKAAMAAGRKK